MPITTRTSTSKRDQLRRWIAIAAVLAVGSLLVEEIADLERRAIGDVLGPVFFAIFVISVLTVVGLSIYLLVTKARPTVGG
jgi:hypothetical protein